MGAAMQLKFDYYFPSSLKTMTALFGRLLRTRQAQPAYRDKTPYFTLTKDSTRFALPINTQLCLSRAY